MRPLTLPRRLRRARPRTRHGPRRIRIRPPEIKVRNDLYLRDRRTCLEDHVIDGEMGEVCFH